MILLLLLQSATACAASDPFAHSTDLFFEHFLRQNADAAIESLDAYHYDGVTYYHRFSETERTQLQKFTEVVEQ